MDSPIDVSGISNIRQFRYDAGDVEAKRLSDNFVIAPSASLRRAPRWMKRL
jgi:hypothetical protein